MVRTLRQSLRLSQSLASSATAGLDVWGGAASVAEDVRSAEAWQSRVETVEWFCDQFKDLLIANPKLFEFMSPLLVVDDQLWEAGLEEARHALALQTTSSPDKDPDPSAVQRINKRLRIFMSFLREHGKEIRMCPESLAALPNPFNDATPKRQWESACYQCRQLWRSAQHSTALPETPSSDVWGGSEIVVRFAVTGEQLLLLRVPSEEQSLLDLVRSAVSSAGWCHRFCVVASASGHLISEHCTWQSAGVPSGVDVILLPLTREFTQQMFEAVGSGRARAVKNFLQQGQDPNSRSDGVPVLIAAINSMSAEEELVTLLVDGGADPDACDDRQVPALHYAMLSCRPALVNKLLNSKANPHVRDHRLNTALHTAEFSRLESVQSLLAHRADPLAENVDGDTPFSLCKHSADINACIMEKAWGRLTMQHILVKCLGDLSQCCALQQLQLTCVTIHKQYTSLSIEYAQGSSSEVDQPDQGLADAQIDAVGGSSQAGSSPNQCTLSELQARTIRHNKSVAKRRRMEMMAVSTTTTRRMGSSKLIGEGLLCKTGMGHLFPTFLLQASVRSTSIDDAMQAEQVPILDHFQILHAHARDDALTFHPETHSYYINGTKTHGSVTSLIHRFVHPFESDAIIDKMICSENWPRPDYLKSYIHPQDFADLSMCPEAAELVSLLGVRGSSSHEICRLAQSLKRRHPALKSLVNAIAMSPSQIVKKWTLQKEEAALLGTRMHACLECILNGGDCPETAEVQLFLKFLHGLEGKIFRTEWKIWGGEEGIAGAIDFVSQKQDGTLVLYDWKRSKALWQKEASYGRHMLPPVSHVPDAPLWHYRLQLNLYKFLLEKYYGVIVSEMFVVGFHPDTWPTGFVDKVPDMQTEAASMMKCQADALPANWRQADVCGGSMPSQEHNAFPEVGQPDAFMDEVPPSQGSVQRTAAKSQPRRPIIKEEDGSAGAIVEMDVEVEQATFEVLKRRRHQPHCFTSAQDFDEHFLRLQAANKLFQGRVREPMDNSHTIIEKVRFWRQRVEAELPGKSDYFIRICARALAFARARLADISLREHALVYWIAEGHRSLRFHAGDCYMLTPSGAFQQHRGVPPDHDRVQTFLMHVEGMFRRLPSKTPRNLQGILTAIEALFAQTTDEAAFLEQCADACLNFEGESGPARRFDRQNVGEGEMREDPEPPVRWNVGTAKNIMVVKKQLAKEMTEEKLLHFMSEWCETPHEPQASCCYDDCAIQYDDELLPAHQVDRRTLENCYLRIPHCIKGAVPQAIVDRLHKFYAQTFWGNLQVFKCGQAAQALAKRGLNVVRLFIGLSSGGVGQSLFSTHLRAMYGHNFAFFDPNIWYNEEEIRKQIEQLNGCCILTGQETPGTNRKLKEDLFKKFASGDGIAGRKPYGFKTRMIHCTGWKRLEANRMFTLSGVTKRDFNSIFRRAFVWQVKSRFEDPHVIESTYPEISVDGIFPKDPNLAHFLVSGPAVAAALQIQHAFEAEHSRQQCEEMIENYVLWGGDGGLTEKTMRSACSLPPRDIRQNATKSSGIIDVDNGSDTERAESKEWDNVRQAMFSTMLSQRRVFFAKAGVLALKFKDGPNVTREEILEGLIHRSLCGQSDRGNAVWSKTPKKGDSAFYFPLMTSQKPFSDIMDHRCRACDLELPEVYDVPSFQQYVCGHPYRKENVTILSGVLEHLGLRKGVGRASAATMKLQESLAQASTKMVEAERRADLLLDQMLPEGKIVKRRRASKSMPNVKEEAEAVVRQAKCSYHYTEPDTLRTRKQVTGVGAQSFTRRAQAHLLGDTVDLDIQNCLFTLMSQLLDKLIVEPQMPNDVRSALDRCATDRPTVCAEELQMSVEDGKKLLVSIFYGGATPERLRSSQFVQNLQRASVFCRWLAMSLFTDEYKCFASAESKKKNPDSSILSHLYFALEDHILTSWCEYIQKEVGPEHLSLHFDGVRLNVGSQKTVAQLCSESEQHILSTTGFRVKVLEKKHRTVLQSLQATACKHKVSDLPDTHILRRTGNCILHGLMALGCFKGNCDEKLADPQSAAYMEQRGSRTYMQCSEIAECPLFPVPFCLLKDVPLGKWLLHMENGSAPHCVAFSYQDSDGDVTVWDTSASFDVSSESFRESLACGIDSSSVVLFGLAEIEQGMLQDSAISITEQISQNLMDLSAAGSDGDSYAGEVWQESEESDVLSDAFEWLDSEGKVTVDTSLVEKLAQEAVEQLKAAQKGAIRKRNGEFPCPACPFRSFDRCCRVVQHLRKYHTSKNQYCCSGTKQVRVILALHDYDMIAQKPSGSYLKRSAALLRTQVSPALSPRNNKVDRWVRLVLDGKGPRLAHKSAIGDCRRLPNGKLSYTRTFAQRLFQEMLLNQGKAR